MNYHFFSIICASYSAKMEVLKAHFRFLFIIFCPLTERNFPMILSGNELNFCYPIFWGSGVLTSHYRSRPLTFYPNTSGMEKVLMHVIPTLSVFQKYIAIWKAEPIRLVSHLVYVFFQFTFFPEGRQHPLVQVIYRTAVSIRQTNKELNYLEGWGKKKRPDIKYTAFLKRIEVQKNSLRCVTSHRSMWTKQLSSLAKGSQTWPSLATPLLSHSRKTIQTCIFSQLWDKENLKAFNAATSYVFHLSLGEELSVFLVKWRQICSTSFLKNLSLL